MEKRKYLLHPRNKYFLHKPVFSSKDILKNTVKLLQDDFNLFFELPEQKSYLVPSITRSLNYLLTVQDLLYCFTYSKKLNIRFLDIGIGANCIFPLLGHKVFPGAQFTGTDISAASLNNAKKLAEKNNLNLDLYSSEKDLFFAIKSNKEKDEFVLVCNPPFFASETEAKNSRLSDNFQGSSHETVCRGGEIEFIKALISQGKDVSKRFIFFSCMLGLKKNCYVILQALEENSDISFVHVEVLRQGRTFRWVVFWSFQCSPFVSLPGKFRKRFERLKMLSNRTIFQFELAEDTIRKRTAEFLGTEKLYSAEPDVFLSLENSRVIFAVQFVYDVNSLICCLLCEFSACRKRYNEFLQRFKASIERENRYWKRRRRLKE
eukprot:maker-scaffold_4-snap-gene-11.6-mRNA-1 protein AED:0.00 eAED:0.00 QI:15/1/1/1/1/1/2/511/375